MTRTKKRASFRSRRAALSTTIQESLANVLRRDDVEPKAKFMAWLITPSRMRTPQTQKELAKILDVAPETLCTWKRDPEFMDAIPQVVRRQAFDAAPEIVEKLAERARAGSLYAIELYFRYVLQWAQPAAGAGSQINDNRAVIMIGGRIAESLPVGLLRAAPTLGSEIKN